MDADDVEQPGDEIGQREGDGDEQDRDRADHRIGPGVDMREPG